MDSGGKEVLSNCDSPHTKTDGIDGARKFPFSLSTESGMNLWQITQI